jgi:hypothetical protein
VEPTLFFILFFWVCVLNTTVECTLCVCGVCGVCVVVLLSFNFARGTMPVTPPQLPKQPSTDSGASSASTHAGSPVCPASTTTKTRTFWEARSIPHVQKRWKPALELAAIRQLNELRKRLDAEDNKPELKELKDEIDFYEQQLREPRNYDTILKNCKVDAEALVAEGGLHPACAQLVQDLLSLLRLEIEEIEAEATAESSAVPTDSVQPVAALGSIPSVYPVVSGNVAAARQLCVNLARECQTGELESGSSLDDTAVRDLKARLCTRYPTGVLKTRSLELPGSNPKTKYTSWLVNPKRFKLSEACPDIASDVPGFKLKAEGDQNEQWPEVLRVLQFVGLYEAYRALLDASTAA